VHERTRFDADEDDAYFVAGPYLLRRWGFELSDKGTKK
jgi:hypothetical protein